MTSLEALEVLGLTGKSSDDEVRRAYLRAVKQHSPERDPEGFRRVREAFDFLKRSYRPEDEREVTAVPLSGESAIHDAKTQAAWAGQSLGALGDEQDPVVASRAIVDAYRLSFVEAESLPSPFFALQTYLRLVERGQLSEAREFFEAFEAFATERQVGATDVEVSAYWRLAREVSEIIVIDTGLASAIASGVRNGDWTDAARRASTGHGSLQQQLPVLAPHVWSALEPWVVPAPPPKGNRKRVWSWAPLAMMGLGLFLALARFLSSGAASDFEPANRSAANAAEQRWGMLDIALESGDCASVNRRWPAYRALAYGNVSATTASERKQQILRTCPMLKQVLEEERP